MKPISEYISDLLMRQDNVIVPEFGGFITRRIPARLSDDGTKISPPFKQVLFHTNLNLSDGVFERYVAHRSNLLFSEASSLVSQTVINWKNQLKRGERIELDKVGFLFLDKDGKIRFEQDRAYNLLLQSYGLGEIVFEKKEAEQIADQTPVLENDSEEITLDLKEKIVQLIPDQEEVQKVVLIQDAVSGVTKVRPLWMKVAAAAVILPFAFYSFWVPLTTDVLETKKLAFADFNPFHKGSQARYNLKSIQVQDIQEAQSQDLDQIVNALPEDAVFYNFNYDDELVLPVRLDKKPGEVEKSEKHPVQNAITSNTSGAQKVHLISGCFSLKENADKHITTLKEMGLDAYLVDIQGGLHRVAALGVSNEQDLNAAAARLNEKNISFWTLKK